MLRRWLIGFLIGTTLVAITSPLFVRSYVPRVEEPTRGVTVLLPGSDYRWRNEGYSTTRIGPLGMPGQTRFPRKEDNRIRFALWGDSQAEGVCVDDKEKIAALVARLSSERIDVLPFARSGDDCNDWIPQIAAIGDNSEDRLSIDAHVFLIVDWPDWCVDLDEAKEVYDESMSDLSRMLPAFVIQTARNVLTTGDAAQMRELRFRPGPVTTRQVDVAPYPRDDSNSKSESMLDKLSMQLDRLRRQTEAPCVFLYAPMIPSITAGQIRFEDPNELVFAQFRKGCARNRFDVIDLRGKMKSAVLAGVWPRGFHNGQFGVGHYNANGNRIIAESILTIPDMVQSTDSANRRRPSQD